jgi:hypothetical protein
MQMSWVVRTDKRGRSRVVAQWQPVPAPVTGKAAADAA